MIFLYNNLNFCNAFNKFTQFEYLLDLPILTVYHMFCLDPDWYSL